MRNDKNIENMATSNVHPALVYTPLQHYSTRTEVEECLQHGSWECLMRLPLALGQSFPDWRYVQAVCTSLTRHENAGIRVNACRGLGYLARTRKRLQKSRVQPILLREYRACKRMTTPEAADLLMFLDDTLSTIRFHLNWCIHEPRQPSKQKAQRTSMAHLRRTRQL
jgi:hypothetical protein